MFSITISTIIIVLTLFFAGLSGMFYINARRRVLSTATGKISLKMSAVTWFNRKYTGEVTVQNFFCFLPATTVLGLVDIFA